MRTLYAGSDLHSNNNFLGIMDGEGKKIFKKRLSNDPRVVLDNLKPFQKELVGIVVESTYNWYWLVDALMEGRYKVHLANPAAIVQYSGLKHAGDQHDAFWLADMLRLGILPEGYIYPKEDRPIRDLLRKRGHLVRLRTSLILSLQNIITRNCGINLNGNQIKRVTENKVAPLLEGQEDLALSGKVSKETIDFLTRQITQVENFIQDKVKVKDQYKYLQTIYGVGKILSLTIMLETGPVERFIKVGNYTSYCRKVPTQWTSNNKTKGKGNKKNGNKYLAWAFSEAAELARRYENPARAYYNKKLAKTNFMVAHTALAHKLARAAYYVMRDQVPFDPGKVFA